MFSCSTTRVKGKATLVCATAALSPSAVEAAAAAALAATPRAQACWCWRGKVLCCLRHPLLARPPLLVVVVREATPRTLVAAALDAHLPTVSHISLSRVERRSRLRLRGSAWSLETSSSAA